MAVRRNCVDTTLKQIKNTYDQVNYACEKVVKVC